MEEETPLSEVEKEYNTARSELYSLAAHGHYTYAPVYGGDGKPLGVEEIRAGQADYQDRLAHTQDRFEAAALRMAGQRLREEYPGPDLDRWIRAGADALERQAAQFD